MIDFLNNSLSGSFPVGMSYNLPALEELYLSTNQFNGSILSFIWECKNLVVVHMSVNNFTRGISERVGNLTSLKELYLSYNKLIGKEIPDLLVICGLATWQIRMYSCRRSFYALNIYNNLP